MLSDIKRRKWEVHLNAKYLRNGRGYLTYGKSGIEMNVWCIWINEIFSIQINSHTKVWYSRWHVFWIVRIILVQIPALLCRISFVTILQANVIFECMHLYMTCATTTILSIVSLLHTRARARALNKTSPLKNASNSRVWCEIKTTALSLSLARIVTGNNDRQKWYRSPQQRYLTFSLESRTEGAAIGYHETF